jgi:DNA-binding transcriptional LysR family regulator
VYLPPKHPDIVIVPLYVDSICLVSHPAFKLDMDEEKIVMKKLHEFPYIHIDWGRPFTEWYQQEVGKHHIQAFQVDNASLMIKFVTSGEGIGFLLNTISSPFIKKGELKYLPIDSIDPLPKRTTYLIYRKSKRTSKAFEAWIDFIKKINKQL